MADIVLERRGTNLRFKTPKLQVAIPAPQQSIIFDQCGEPVAKKVSGSFQISGRRTCFDPVQEILRVSYRYFYNNAPEDLLGLNNSLYTPGSVTTPALPEGIFVPNPPGFIAVRQHFNNLQRLPVETSIVGANYPLVDVCGVVSGTVEDKNLQKYGYTDECKAVTRYGFSTTVARHSSITNGFVGAAIDVLSGFALAQQDTISTPATPISNNNAEMLAAWAGLIGQPITIPVGDFEDIPGGF